MEEQILQILQEDAHTTPAQIAERLGRSPAWVRKQIKQLEAQGVIHKYKAVINWEKAAHERVFAFIEVKVAPQRGVGFDAVAERILRFPEVHSLYLMSGAYDLHVVVQGDNMKEVAYFVAEKLAPLEHIQSTATHFVLKRYKVDGDIFAEMETAERLPVTL
jgi:DNA-binding Lrp family transcriptional regulator